MTHWIETLINRFKQKPEVSRRINMDDKSLVMYTRTAGCPYVSVAKRVLEDYQVPYQEVFIDLDDAAKQRLLDWVGFLSVPTLIVAPIGEVLPYEAPAYLPKGDSPRGIDRGSMITEASHEQLLQWLIKHGFLTVSESEI
ncbi:MAG: glutaredoxin family protein [Anaerolineae bacterium]|jgi:glutaredoxin|nr:glutaredoxin family protein [Anaerolineae bacterium]